jgi:capsule polysaccharide export protein KpsE/RkpR
MLNLILRSAAALALLATAPAFAQQAAPAEISPAQVQQLIDTLKQRNDQLRMLSERVREAEARATRADAAMTRLQAAEKALAIAAEKNQALVATGEEIIAKYEKMSLGKRALTGEPYTQLYRVRMQNDLQVYRDKIAELGFYPEKEMQPAQPATPAQPAAPEPAN